ncbi:MAG: ornithine cyclodeaminase family protein [Pseudomonadota bacterium]
MEVLIADQNQVRELLPMASCLEVMAEALEGMARGGVIMPLRSKIVLPDGESIMGWMPGYADDLQAMGIKVISAFPKNEGGPHDSHIGVVLLFEAGHGLLRAIVDATALTAIRTAAVSGVATRTLARPGAGDLALLGSGAQAAAHLEAMMLVRDIRRVRVFSRNPENAASFARRESRKRGLTVEAVPSAREAVEGADIICTVTSAARPVLSGDWVAPGAHINAVGAFRPQTRELDSNCVLKARLYADKKEALVAEAGDFLIPRDEGLVDESHIVGELGQVLAGLKPGRQNDREITLFKSLGLAVEDIAAAAFILKEAGKRGVGTFLEIGGRRFGED